MAVTGPVGGEDDIGGVWIIVDMLASATRGGVAAPPTPGEGAPPMITTSFTKAAMPGSRLRARARLVSGATASIVTLPGLALMISTILSAAMTIGRSGGETLGDGGCLPSPSSP